MGEHFPVATPPACVSFITLSPTINVMIPFKDKQVAPFLLFTLKVSLLGETVGAFVGTAGVDAFVVGAAVVPLVGLTVVLVVGLTVVVAFVVGLAVVVAFVVG
jgi:hypothetical protein